MHTQHRIDDSLKVHLEVLTNLNHTDWIKKKLHSNIHNMANLLNNKEDFKRSPIKS